MYNLKGCSTISRVSATERTTSNFQSSSAAATAKVTSIKSRPQQNPQELQLHRKYLKPLLRPENKRFLKSEGYQPY